MQFPANTFNDADGDTLSYSAVQGDDSALPTWLSFTEATRTFSGTPQSTDVGTVAVKVTASDGNGGSVSDTFNIVVTATPQSPANGEHRPCRGTQTVTEGAAVVFRVTASRAVSANLTVNLNVGDASNADFVSSGNEGSQSVTIASGSSTADFTLSTEGGSGETTDEPEWHRVGVGECPARATRWAARAPQLVTVEDNDPTRVTLSVPDATATEGSSSDRATVRLALNRALRSGESLAIPLGFSGGVLGTDFSLSLSGTPTGVALSSNTVTFTGSSGGSATSADILLSASADVDAADETVTVSIPSSSTTGTPRLTATLLGGGATGSRTGNGEIVLSDDDTAALVFSPTSLTVGEGSSGSYTVRLATLPTGNVTVTVAGATGDVTVDTNSGSPGNQNTLSFTTSTWNTAQTVTVAAGEDVDTTNDSATLTHTAAGGGYNSITGNVAVTVTDNDEPNSAPTVANVIADQSATAGTAFSYQFPADTFADADNDSLGYTATRGDDSALPTWLSFTDNSRTFSGTPQSADVGTLSVKVTASDGNGGTVSDTFNIVVSAAPVIPSLSISGGGAVTEGTAASFTVTASTAPSEALILLRDAEDVTGSDFLAAAQEGDNIPWVFPRGETSRTFTIPTVGDSTVEQSGDIRVTLRPRPTYTVGSPGSATVRVNDDDAQPVTPVNPVTPVVSLPRVSISGGNAVVEGGPCLLHRERRAPTRGRGDGHGERAGQRERQRGGERRERPPHRGGE